MQHLISGRAPALVLALLFSAQGLAPAALAETGKPAAQTHDAENTVYKGYFEDAQVKPRELADWAGEWQSVYPYLADGTLDPVFEHKAEHGDKSAADHRAYYEVGYKTDVERIVIDQGRVAFTRGGARAEGVYEADGHEILTYQKGNRGVRYIFRKVSGDDAAPAFIQFSDHRIAPEKADHYHLYFGNDRAALLQEVTNWPTYYPARLSGAEIVDEMLAH
jgi:zinc transport system substrate-binding protein